MLVEPNKVQNILSRIFQIDVRHYYSAVVSWSCDTKLGTAAPVLCFFPVRTINTRLLLTHAYGPFQWLQNHVYAVSYVSLSDGPLEVSVPRPYGALFSSLGCAYSTLIILCHSFAMTQVREYWRNSTSYTSDLSPTYSFASPNPFHQRTTFRRTSYSFSLPLRDREVVSLRDRLPCIIDVYDFMVRTHHLDLLSKLLVYHLVDLLLRNGWHSISLSYV